MEGYRLSLPGGGYRVVQLEGRFLGLLNDQVDNSFGMSTEAALLVLLEEIWTKVSGIDKRCLG